MAPVAGLVWLVALPLRRVRVGFRASCMLVSLDYSMIGTQIFSFVDSMDVLRPLSEPYKIGIN